MSKDTSFALSQLMTKIDLSLQVASSLVDKKIDVPEYDDKEKVRKLYDGYASTVADYSLVCDNLSKMAQFSIQLKQVRTALNTASELQSIVQSQKREIESMLKRIAEVRESLIFIKDKYDALLRFYGSAQYMTTSNRYNEIGY